jgi:dipeptide/tripeptide permease
MNININDTTQQSPESDAAKERVNRVSTAGWTAGLSALFACIVLGNSPTWPVAFGVAAVAAMVGVVCCAILKGGS